MEHLVDISPVDSPKTRATEGGPASAEAGSVVGAVVVAAAGVVEGAVDAAEAAAGDDASWRFGSLPRILCNRSRL